MKQLILDLHSLLKASLTLDYAQFVELIDVLLKYKGELPNLLDKQEQASFLKTYCGFSQAEFSFICSAENAQEVYNFLLENLNPQNNG